MVVRQLDLGALAPPPGGSDEDAPILRDLNLLRLCSGHKVVFDTETTGLHWWKDRVIGVAFWCPDAGVSGYVPTMGQAEVDILRDIMLSWSPDTVVINHNIKFDFHQMGIDPLTVPWRYYDTVVMAHLVDARGVPKPDGMWDRMEDGDQRGSLSLGRLAEYHLRDTAKLDYQKMMKKGNTKLQHHQWPIRVLSRYAVDDARLTYELAHVLAPIVQRRGQWNLFLTSMKYLGILWRTERHGLRLDIDYLLGVQQKIQRLSREFDASLHEAIQAQCGLPVKFDWTSPIQLSEALYERYGWRKPRPHESTRGMKITATATSSEVLSKVARHPLAGNVIQLRALQKTEGYVTKWMHLADGNGFLHPSFNQTATLTSRLSSSDPNTQQIPGDDRNPVAMNAFEDTLVLEEFMAAMNMRAAFVAPEGTIYAGNDYSQQEIRMFAILSGDQQMLQTVEAEDIHAEMAQVIWGQRQDPYRSDAKTMSLGVLYGMGKENMANKIGDNADRVMAQYHAKFPGIKRWQRQVIKQIEESGYVTYWSGRRYYRSDERGYKAVNALVQGGSADLLMHAVVELHGWIERERLPIRFVNYVHDEVDFEIDKEAFAELSPQIAERMSMPHLLGIPFKTEMKAGPSLGTMEKVKA